MKRFTRLVCFALALTMVLGLAATACAEEDAFYSPLFDVYDFKFEICEKGLGLGLCPVYTAPDTSSVRNANGKASVDTSDQVDVAGLTNNGWLLIRYKIKGGSRVGYIPRNYVGKYETHMAFHFSDIPQTASRRIAVTDSTASKAQPFAYLEEGDPYTILAKYTYTGNFWYIEFDMNGQTARGFIDRANTPVDRGDGVVTTELGDPPYNHKKETLQGHIRVEKDNIIVRADADTAAGMVARAHLGDVYPFYTSKTGSTGKVWYQIFVDGVWGWISSGVTSECD